MLETSRRTAPGLPRFLTGSKRTVQPSHLPWTKPGKNCRDAFNVTTNDFPGSGGGVDCCGSSCSCWAELVWVLCQTPRFSFPRGIGRSGGHGLSEGPRQYLAQSRDSLVDSHVRSPCLPPSRVSNTRPRTLPYFGKRRNRNGFAVPPAVRASSALAGPVVCQVASSLRSRWRRIAAVLRPESAGNTDPDFMSKACHVA